MITNDTNFAWNLRREVLATFVEEGWATCLVAQVLGFKEEMENMGIELVDVKIDRRGKNPFSDIRLLKKYLKVLKKQNPDLVFTNNTKPNIYAGLACQICKIPYVANITGLGTAVETSGKLQWLSTKMYKCGVKKAETLFFQNQQNQLFFHQRRMIGKNTNEKLLPGSGVNLVTHPLLPYPEDDITNFLFVARILKEKGIDLFLAAARKFHSDRVKFHICGMCDDEKYKKILEEEQKNGTVIYHGEQKNMRPFFEMCSCVLHPSYYPEGMSNVLLEGAACGRPLICADRAGCRETVDDGVTGFVVPVQDEVAVLSAVEKFLLMSQEERKQMGLAGRKKVEREFDRQIVVNEYLKEISRNKK